MPTYTVDPQAVTITCHACGHTSNHPDDVHNEYCPVCKVHHSTVLPRNRIELAKRRSFGDFRGPLTDEEIERHYDLFGTATLGLHCCANTAERIALALDELQAHRATHAGADLEPAQLQLRLHRQTQALKILQKMVESALNQEDPP